MTALKEAGFSADHLRAGRLDATDRGLSKMKQAEEKYSPLQRAIEEVGPELGEFEGKRADVVHVGHSA